ncbi:MAG: hypothetical protein U1F48_00830 [Burkholderiales bacterium]
MDIYPSNSRENRGFASGMRTAVVVVVLGTLAVVADQAFFVTPQPVAHAVAAEAPVPAALVPGDTLPPELHPTAADVTPPAPTF